MDQSIDSGLNLDENAKVGDISNRSLHDGSGRISLGDILPWIGLKLLHSKGNLLPFRINVENFHRNDLA